MTISSNISHRCFFVDFAEMRKNVMMSVIGGCTLVVSDLGLTDIAVIDNILQNVLRNWID